MQAGALWNNARKYRRFFEGHGWYQAPCGPHLLSYSLEIPQALKRTVIAKLHPCKLELLYLQCNAYYTRKSGGKYANEFQSNILAFPSRESTQPSLLVHGLCMSAYLWREGIYRQLLWLCKSCTKFHEHSSWFAKGSQIPILSWQLGGFG